MKNCLFALLLIACAVGEAHACTICVPFPIKTDADHLIESDAVVLARENPDKPFSFRVRETLAGDPAGTDIDLFLNSAARRMLLQNPDRGVVLARSGSGEWRSLGFADAAYEDLVRRIVRSIPHWGVIAEEGADDRLSFFASYLGSDHRRIHRLAYLEVGRAPYGKIKQFSSAWPLESIRSMLADPLYVEWRPLAILMLAHNGTDDDRAYIKKRLGIHARFGITTNLAAWATAVVELERSDGIDMIEDHYFHTTGRTREELNAVVQALSEHGSNGHIDLRERIMQSYSILLRQYPEMAAAVATDLTAWERWELVGELSRILTTEELDPLTAYAIKWHLSRAKKASWSL